MPKYISMLLVATMTVSPVAALAEPLETLQLKDDLNISGQALGFGRLYKIIPSAARTVTFSVTINPYCHYTLQKGSRRDFQSRSGIEPIELTDIATIGEPYILSFSQTRLAWQAGDPCSFSFSLK